MTILVGVHPGHRSLAVLHTADMLARSLDDDIVVAAVTRRGWPPTAWGTDAEWSQYARDAANVVLDHAASVLSPEIPVRYVLHEASSGRRGILELVEQYDATLVVLGSSSAGAMSRIALGSEADALLHVSPVPVALAPRGYRLPRGTAVGRVTAAYSGSDTSADVVIGAAGFAATAGAALRVASFAVLPDAPVTARVGLDAANAVRQTWAEQIGVEVAALLDRIAGLSVRPPSVEAVVGMGGNWPEAVEDVDWVPGDILAVGSSGTGPLARVFLGSHAAKVVRNAPVPVIVVPRASAAELAARAGGAAD